MSIMTLASKFLQYGREAQYSWRASRNALTAAQLTRDTLAFHFSNFLPRSGNASRQVAHAYRLKTPLGDDWNVYLRPLTGDFFVFYEVFLEQCYQLPSWLTGRPKQILDLGANVGLTSLYFSRMFPGSRFACVEPDTSNLEVLRMNLAGLDHPATIIPGAVAGETTARTFLTADTWGGRLDVRPDAPSAGTTTVQCYSMTDVIAQSGFTHVDVLKIDIEGAEKEIFGGAVDWLGMVGVILIEFHEGYSLADFRHVVEPRGFTVFEGGSSFGNIVTIAVSKQVLATAP